MRIASLFAILSACAFAQQPHSNGATIFGNMTNPAPPPRGVAVPPNGRPHNAPPPVHSHWRNGSSAVIVPFPIYYGDYAPGYSTAPSEPVYSGYPDNYSSQAPIVIINQSFRPDVVNPSIRDYSDVPLPQSTIKRFDGPGPSAETTLRDDEPTIFLIAMKDHTIFPAIAYWADGETLNWVTREAKQNRVSLDLVDREFSRQLNEERHVEFKLPPVKN